jgi:aspartate/methionine/tyrosine aminotransferase
VCFPRYLGDEVVEEFCRALLEEAGVVLLPASIFASPLAEVPADRFRIGLGRRNPEPALAAFGEFLRRR